MLVFSMLNLTVITEKREAHAAIPVVAYYGGTALAALLAAYGINMQGVDFEALYREFDSFMDGCADTLKSTASAANEWAMEKYGEDTEFYTTDWSSPEAQSYIEQGRAQIEAWGEAGEIDLDMLKNDVLGGFMPLALSSFIASLLVGTPGGDTYQGSLGIGNADVPIHLVSGSLSGSNVYYNGSSHYEILPLVQIQYNGMLFAIGSSRWTSSNVPTLSYLTENPLALNWAKNYMKVSPFGAYDHVMYWDSTYSAWVPASSTLVSAEIRDIANTVSNLARGYWNPEITSCPDIYNNLYFLGSVSWTFGTALAWDAATQGWKIRENLTDNPDVNLGRDWYDDAQTHKDILNPAQGGVLVGADAVFNGDYLLNRGKVGIPTDWTDVNSWADALSKLRTGVAEGAADGTISGSDAITVGDAATGSIVDSTVSDAVGNEGTWSTQKPKPSSWDKLKNPELYLFFPFCLPWDMYEIISLLSSSAQAPVFEFPIKTNLVNENIKVDLSPYEPVAVVFRAMILLLCAFGLIWVTKKMIRN